MEFYHNQMKDHGYERISGTFTNMQLRRDTKSTLLRNGCFLLVFLNLVTSLGSIGGCLFYTGLNSILYMFYGTSHDRLVFWNLILNGALLTAATLVWVVIIGYFIRSLIKSKQIRAPKLLCNQTLHASAVWIVIFRVVLGGVICALDLVEILETHYITTCLVFLIEFAVNVTLILCYYWYAVKLNFGLRSIEAEDAEYIQNIEVINEKPRPICEDTTGVSPTTNNNLS